jgi:hypothetical protein
VSNVAFKPGDRVFWDLCGRGTIVELWLPGYWKVMFDDGVPVEYSTSNPCLVMESKLKPLPPEDDKPADFSVIAVVSPTYFVWLSGELFALTEVRESAESLRYPPQHFSERLGAALKRLGVVDGNDESGYHPTEGYVAFREKLESIS